MTEDVFEGQCQCGAIHYRVTGVALTLFACHCTECQRQAGSAFGMALWIKQPVVEISGGTVKEWIRTMPSGKQMACQFCPDCGTRLFHKVVGQDQVLSIKPGTLYQPGISGWIASSRGLSLTTACLSTPAIPIRWTISVRRLPTRRGRVQTPCQYN
jgi:hypothetical protein